MRRAFAIGTIFTFSLLLGGCAEDTNKIMASWEGHNINDVIAQWGPPSQVLDDPPGKIMTWARGGTIVMPGASRTGYVPQPGVYGGGYYETTAAPTMATTFTSTRTFWVNGSGTITRWAWRGE
jgi:hypothetical protein